MATDAGRSAYNAAITQRTRELRIAKGLTQEAMAKILGITAEAYRKYEGRTPLPHYLIETFVLVADSSIQYFVTGNGRKVAPSATQRTPLKDKVRPFRKVR